MLWRLVVTMAFAVEVWAICAALTSIAFWVSSPRIAYAVQLVAAPPVAVFVALVYFERKDALHPLLAAMVVGATAFASTLLLDRLFQRQAEGVLGAVISLWLPVVLLAATTFAVGAGRGGPARSLRPPT